MKNTRNLNNTSSYFIELRGQTWYIKDLKRGVDLVPFTFGECDTLLITGAVGRMSLKLKGKKEFIFVQRHKHLKDYPISHLILSIFKRIGKLR